MIRTSYAGDSRYGANEEASPCAPEEAKGFRMGAPLTDRDLATTRGRSIEGMADSALAIRVKNRAVCQNLEF